MSRLINYLAIADVIQVKGSIYYKLFQGHIMFETEMYINANFGHVRGLSQKVVDFLNSKKS